MGTTIKEDVDLNNIYEEVIKYFWCDKGTSHSYIPIYEKLFSEYRNKHIKLVEVGILMEVLCAYGINILLTPQ